MAQPPQAPKKSKKGLITVISVIVVVVLLLAGVGAVLALRSKGSTAHTASTSTPTTHNTPTTSGVTPAATQPAGGTTPSTGSNGSSGSVGQPVQAGSNWVVTITHVKATTSSAFPPKAGNTYLEISLTLKNVSATKQIVSSLLQFNLTGSGGSKYTEALTDTNIHQPPDGDIKAGQTLNAQMAFEVPQAQHSFVLTFEYGLTDGSGAATTWPITV
jgi:flagellar basal body-associated protein FliL